MGIATKILLVEDDRYIALALKIRLQAEGFDVFVASGCAQALDTAIECQPDIAVIDYNLHDGNGLDLMQRFSVGCHPMPIASIMMTASKKPGLCQHALEQGAFAYFEKPFNSSDLIDSINNFRAASCSCVAA